VQAPPEGGGPVPRIGGAARVQPERPNEVRAVIRVEVRAQIPGQAAAAVDDAARDGAALAVAVLQDRRRDAGRVAAGGRLEAVVALGHVPPVVLAAPAGGEADVDLLPLALPDVGDHEVAGGAVEGEAPGIAQAVGPDLAARAAGREEGVVGGNGVGVAA